MRPVVGRVEVVWREVDRLGVGGREVGHETRGAQVVWREGANGRAHLDAHAADGAGGAAREQLESAVAAHAGVHARAEAALPLLLHAHDAVLVPLRLLPRLVVLVRHVEMPRLSMALGAKRKEGALAGDAADGLVQHREGPVPVLGGHAALGLDCGQERRGSLGGRGGDGRRGGVRVRLREAH